VNLYSIQIHKIEEAAMTQQWLYASNEADPSIYQQGKYLYDAYTHRCLYYRSGSCIYPVAGRGSAFYVVGKWLYEASSHVAKFYYAEDKIVHR
jgi:hypothetical protein